MQTLAIAGGVVLFVGAVFITGGLVAAFGATEGVEGLEVVHLAFSVPFVLAPPLTMGALGLSAIGWGVYSSVTSPGSAKGRC